MAPPQPEKVSEKHLSFRYQFAINSLSTTVDIRLIYGTYTVDKRYISIGIPYEHRMYHIFTLILQNYTNTPLNIC